MATYYLYEVDLSTDLNVYAQKHKPKDLKEPIFKISAVMPFNPSFDVDDKNFKKIKDDALLTTVLHKASDPTYQQMLVDVENLVADCCKRWATKANDTNKELDVLWAAIEKKLTESAEAMQNRTNPLLKKYIEDRQLGKLAKAKYKSKQMKGIAKVAAGVAGTGLAIAAAVGSHGATSAGVFVALYGTYKAVKETADAFRAEAKTIEEYLASIEKTKHALNDKYLKLPKEDQKLWIAVGEVKAKAANEFLKLKTQSIKKLEEDIKHLERHIDMAFLAASKQGKAVTEMEKALLKYAEAISAMSKEAAELAPSEKLNKTIEKIKKSREKGAVLMNKVPVLLKAAVAERENVEKVRDDTLPDYKEYAKDLKDKRPGWVSKASIPMKAVPVLLSAAGGNYHELAMGAGEAMNPAIELGTEAFKELAMLVDENKKNLVGGKK
jgi:hypothetical protein